MNQNQKKARREKLNRDKKISKVNQSFKSRVDIRKIMRRGSTAETSGCVLKYGDFRTPIDLMGMMEIKNRGEAAWRQIPSKIRKYFSNDRDEFLKFIAKSDNLDEAIRIGLCHKKTEPRKSDPIEVRVVADPDKPAEPDKAQ